MSVSKLGDLNPIKTNPENLKKAIKHNKMSGLEVNLLKIIERNNLPFNYVGDGKVVLNGFCPDFLSKNPKHIIELFSGYHKFSGRKERDERRLKAYSLLGYKTLIIWQHELLYEDKIVNKIKAFIR